MNMDAPGAKLAKFEDLAGGLQSLTGGGGDRGTEMVRFANFAKMLFQNGLSVADAEGLARNMGMDLGIEDSRLSAGALKQFVDAIKSSEFSQFDQSFTGQMDFIDTLLGVSGSTDPRDRMKLILDRLAGPEGSPYLASLFGAGGPQGLDTASAEEIREQLVKILTDMNAGTFNTANFGELRGSDFVRTIETLADLLSQVAGASPAPPSPGGTPTGAGISSPGVGLPTAPRVDVPSAPTVLRDGTATDLGSLLGSKLDVVIDQGATMIGLQERIATATEQIPLLAEAIAAMPAPSGAGTPSISWFDEELERQRNLAAVTRGD
jgi:hypothetical protein